MQKQTNKKANTVVQMNQFENIVRDLGSYSLTPRWFFFFAVIGSINLNECRAHIRVCPLRWLKIYISNIRGLLLEEFYSKINVYKERSGWTTRNYAENYCYFHDWTWASKLTLFLDFLGKLDLKIEEETMLLLQFCGWMNLMSIDTIRGICEKYKWNKFTFSLKSHPNKF